MQRLLLRSEPGNNIADIKEQSGQIIAKKSAEGTSFADWFPKAVDNLYTDHHFSKSPL